MANITEVPVAYKDGGSELRGYVTFDEAIQGKRPGVVVLHEWWGITRHVRDEARYLAGLGYTAFVADLYGEGRTADNPTDAAALMNALMSDAVLVRARFEAAEQQLVKHPTVDATRIGASGYCMGGAVALNMARAGHDLRAVASFHGNLTARVTAQPGEVKARIIALNGADDPFVSAESIEAFRKEMAAAKVDFRFVNYPGAVHAFTNPEATAKGQKFNLPLRYDAVVDKQAKAEAARWFAESFR
jgi:dienelactone hydrolase